MDIMSIMMMALCLVTVVYFVWKTLKDLVSLDVDWSSGSGSDFVESLKLPKLEQESMITNDRCAKEEENIPEIIPEVSEVPEVPPAQVSSVELVVAIEETIKERSYWMVLVWVIGSAILSQWKVLLLGEHQP